MGIVLSGPQAPWGSPSPRGGHLRQVPPPTTTAPPLTPRDGAALPLPGAASAGQMCRSGRTHEPRRAERRFRAGRRPRQVWSWSGRYGGVPGSGPAPPGHLPSGGRCHVPAGPRSSPSPRLQNPPNGVGEGPPLVRRTPRRPRDRRVRCCRYRRPTTQPRTTDHPQGLGQDGRKWHVPGRIPSELQDVGARTAHSLDAG